MYGELPSIQLSDTDTSIPGFPVVIESSLTGPKTAVLRLPSSDEMIAYLQAQRSTYQDLGRRKSQSESVPTPKADQRLFRALLLGSTGEEFDEAEIRRAIDLITYHRVKDCVREGNEYRIGLTTLFGAECVHVVRIPYESEKAAYFREFVKSVDLPHGKEERRFPPEAPVKLYDSIVRDAAGYADNVTHGVFKPSFVPPHHKRSVVNELITTLSSLDSDPVSTDPNS